MVPWPFKLVVGSKRALVTGIVIGVLALASVFLASPLRGVAYASMLELVRVAESERHDLSPDWQWKRESVQYEQMYRQRPERRARGSFDRVLDMAKQ
jgi:hypothetical protein